MGRPSSFTQETADTICQALADGKSLRSICKDDALPSMGTVLRWLSEREEFRRQYALAREAQAEAFADEIVEISDNSGEKADPTRDKLRVDARKWVAAKLLPRKYGDSVQLKHADHEGKAIDLADTGAAARMAALLEAVRQRAAITHEAITDGSAAGQASEPQD